MSKEFINMSEEKPRISRRDFLKLIGGAGGVLAFKYLGLDKLDTWEERAAQVSLSAKLNNGRFDPENLGEIPTFDDLKSEIGKRTEALTGVSAAGLYVADSEKDIHMSVGRYSDQFIPGSLIKIPLMYQVWKRGQEDGQEYLTEEAAGKILEKSEYSGDFLMSLPFNRGRKPEDLQVVIGEMLEGTGIKPSYDDEGNMSVSHSEYFDFIRQTKLPPVMMDAMKQTEEDDDTNYGISKVMRMNSGGSEDIYFKIGLAKQGEEAVNSYAIMVGQKVKAVGYAKGNGVQDVHEQMLFAAAAIAKASST